MLGASQRWSEIGPGWGPDVLDPDEGAGCAEADSVA